MIRDRRVILWSFKKIVYFVLQSTVFNVSTVSSVVDRFAEQRAPRLHMILSARRRFASSSGEYGGRPAIKPTSSLVAARPDVAVGDRRCQVEVNAQLGGCRSARRCRRRCLVPQVAGNIAPTSWRPRRRFCRSRGSVLYPVTVVRLHIHRRRRLQHDGPSD